MNSGERINALLRSALRVAKVGFWDWELATGRVTFSPEWKHMLGDDDELVDVAPRAWEERVHPDDLARLRFELDALVEGRTASVSCEHRLRHRDGSYRWFHAQGDAIRDDQGRLERVLCTHTDVTSQRASVVELARSNRALRMLSDSNQALIRATEERSLLEQVCATAVELGGYRAAWVGLGEEAGVVRRAAEGGDSAFLAERFEIDGQATARGPASLALRARGTSLARDLVSDPELASLREIAEARGLRSAIGLPLLAGDRAFGALEVFSDAADAFDAEEIEILAELAGDVAYGLEALRTRAERDRVAAELRAANENLEKAQRIAHVGHWERDFRTGRVTWSDEALRMFGLAEHAPSLAAQSALVHEDDREAFAAMVADAMKGARPYEIEYRIRRPDGDVRHVYSVGRVEHDERGAPTRAFGVMQDVTDTRRAEHAARAAERGVRALVDNLPDVVLRLDTSARLTFVGESVRRVLGVDPARLEGLTPSEVARELGIRERGLTTLTLHVIATGRAERVEAEYDLPAGSRLFEIRVVPERDEAGIVQSALWIASDVTERRQADRKVLWLSHALDQVQDSIFIINASTPTFEYVNARAAEKLGRTREALTSGLGIADVDSRFRPEAWTGRDWTPASPSHFRFESVHRARDGREYPVEVTLTRFEFGDRAHWLSIARDITDRKEAERALRESEALYRTLVNAMAEGVIVRHAEGGISTANPTAERILGRSREELVGWSPRAADWEATREDGTPFDDVTWPPLAVLRTGRAERSVPARVLRPDGTRVWIEISSEPLFRPGVADPYAIVTTIHDVSERRAAIDAAAARELEYRTLAENTPDLIVRWDRELHRVYANPAFASAMRVPPSAIVGEPLGSHYAPETLRRLEGKIDVLRNHIARVFARGAAEELPLEWFTVDGPAVYLIRFIPERGPDGHIRTVLGLGRDITTLKEREHELRTLTEHSPDVLLRLDPAGHVLYSNGVLERITGVVLAGGAPLSEQPGPSELYATIASLLGAVFAGGGAQREAEVSTDIAGDPRVFDVRVVAEPDEGGGLATALVVARDVTEKWRAEDALRASELRFRQVTEAIDEVFWLASVTRGDIVYVSPAYERVFGVSTESLYANPGSWIDVVLEEDRPRLRDAIASGRGSWDLEYRILRGDGTVAWIHDRAFPIRDATGALYRVAGVAADVTVARQLRDQLRQAQKMEAIGRLAGGIAHDFNNMLAVVRMQATLLLQTEPLHKEAREGVEDILAAAERASGLTHQLLTFSRRQIARPRYLDLSEVLGATTKLLRSVLGEHIGLETRFSPSLPAVHADPGMMEQVLMNLAINARDAMPTGGSLNIALDVASLGEERTAVHPGTSAGPYVCLSVTDTGSGIPADALPRIFEPFFTTKEVGKGTGLGLATAFAIVEQHKGWIEVDSRIGEGTTFRVYLPAAAGVAHERDSRSDRRASRGGAETIFLVEDDPAVRSVLHAGLARLGYRVIEAASGVDALDVWERAAYVADLLLTDLVMPGGISGRELAARLVVAKPSLAVLFTSGYSPETDDLEHPLLRKPFSAEELARAVRERLDARRSRG